MDSLPRSWFNRTKEGWDVRCESPLAPAERESSWNESQLFSAQFIKHYPVKNVFSALKKNRAFSLQLNIIPLYYER
jgi:hypothetical protein